MLFLALFVCSFCFGQNVKIEIIDYYKKDEGKEFSMYQFANASYSSSRASILFITPKRQFLNLINKISGLYTKKKQEYTDVWILGIDIDDKRELSEIEKKIINNFLEKVIKYRSDNDLPPYDLNRLNEEIIFLDNYRNVCKYLICSKPL